MATSPADIEEISKIFYQLENTWNDRDVAGYKALWAPYSEVITKRGQVFKSDPKKEDPDMINRMKAERRKYKPDTNRIKVNGDKASAIVYLDSPEGKLIMDYKLEKMDGKWLIKQQRAQ